MREIRAVDVNVSLAGTMQHVWSLTAASIVLVSLAMLEFIVRMSVAMLSCVKMMETALTTVSLGHAPVLRSFMVRH